MSAGLVAEYLTRPYSKVLVPDSTGGFTAQVLEFPGCIAEGETPDEAIRNLDDSMEAWIEAVLEAGKPVPEPLASQGYSGRLALRLPKWVHKEAARHAQTDGVSLNQWIVEAIAERLGAESYSERLLEKTLSALGSPVATMHGILTTSSFQTRSNVDIIKAPISPMGGAATFPIWSSDVRWQKNTWPGTGQQLPQISLLSGEDVTYNA